MSDPTMPANAPAGSDSSELLRVIESIQSHKVAAESRAAALAEALRKIRSLCGRCAIDDIARDALRADDAALAGNGNGNGTGEG